MTEEIIEQTADTLDTPQEQVQDVTTTDTVSPEEPQSMWQQDGRYKTVWKENPDEMYKSYKSLETKLQEQGTEIGKYKGESDNLNEQLGKYQNLTNYLDSISKNPEWSQKFESLVGEYNKQVRRDAYGADIPDNIVEKLNRVDQLEDYVKQQEEQKQVGEQLKVIENQTQEIDEIAKKYNLDYDKSEFINWCKENEIGPKDMKAYFIQESLPKLTQAMQTKTQNTVTKNMKSNQVASLSNGDKRPIDVQMQGNLKDDIMKALS